MIGSNEDEWYMYVAGDPVSFEAELLKLPAPARDALRAHAHREPGVRRGHDQALTFANMVCPAYLMAQAAARRGQHAWVYRFTRVRPGPGGERLRAYHGAEIPYVFDSHDAWLPGDADDARLTDAMMRHWSNFARTGNPNGNALPAWPAFSRDDARVQELGVRIGPMQAPDAELCESLSATLYPGSGR
jgi:para-nitrobenzyl esterase